MAPELNGIRELRKPEITPKDRQERLAGLLRRGIVGVSPIPDYVDALLLVGNYQIDTKSVTQRTHDGRPEVVTDSVDAVLIGAADSTATFKFLDEKIRNAKVVQMIATDIPQTGRKEETARLWNILRKQQEDLSAKREEEKGKLLEEFENQAFQRGGAGGLHDFKREYPPEFKSKVQEIDERNIEIIKQKLAETKQQIDAISPDFPWEAPTDKQLFTSTRHSH